MNFKQTSFSFEIIYFSLSVFIFILTNAQNIIDENASTSVFDLKLYEKVLNAEQCQKQIRYMIANNSFLLSKFLDASMRVPRGLFEGNSVDFGNYYQCLYINESHEGLRVAGKYCIMNVPFYQDLILPGFSGSVEMSDINKFKLGPVPQWLLQKYYAFIKAYKILSSADGNNPLSGVAFKLAACVPQACTIKEAINTLLFNITSIGFQYDVEYCRLPNDKPWVSADYVAIVIFSIIAVLTLLSSLYILFYIFVLKRAEDSSNVYYRLFSMYHNTRLLLDFPKNGDTLKCLDGMRTISTMWIIFGHAFTSLAYLQNPFTEWKWMISAQSWYITSVPTILDTFFALTGILLVYTNAKKMDGMTLLRNLHLFYLNRFLRLFPLMAITVILYASLLHKIADGPNWTPVAISVLRCRKSWWSTLLNLQNYLNPNKMCVPHSFHVALDFQLHILSPLLLYWLLIGNRRAAWHAIVATLTLTLAASAIYNYRMELPSHMLMPSRGNQMMQYITKYYFHIISRITPFIVGMVFGYLLHLWRWEKVRINKILVLFLWCSTFGFIVLEIYVIYRVKQSNWDNRLVDMIVNTLMRPAWATAVGWIVVACVHGYGGPINWFLSLPMWQLPARLCYGMYLFHYPIILIANCADLSPPYFSAAKNAFHFLAYLIISFVLSFIFTLTVDVPFTILFRRIYRGKLVESRSKLLEECEIHELEERKNID